jgi:hypothetical protein
MELLTKVQVIIESNAVTMEEVKDQEFLTGNNNNTNKKLIRNPGAKRKPGAETKLTNNTDHTKRKRAKLKSGNVCGVCGEATHNARSKHCPGFKQYMVTVSERTQRTIDTRNNGIDVSNNTLPSSHP